jgi:phosphate/sulfate permease
MNAELKLKLEESATPPPLPTLMASTDTPARVMSDIRIHSEANDFAESLPKGILGGVIAALLAAILWGIITGITKWQIGWMAVGVGALVGFGVRRFGRGTSSKFGFVGATLSLSGCLVGKLLAYCIIDASKMDISLAQTALYIVNEPGAILEILYASFGPMDFLFYTIALYQGYRFSFSNVANEY